jgi:hypothetical protein
MSDDVAPSTEGRADPSDYRFVQGTVLEWDAITGTNKVLARGAELEDLPSLGGSDIGLLRDGDPVILAQVNNTYAVFGRLELPGATARALGVVSARADDEVDFSTNTGSSFVTLPDGPSVVVEIGSTRRCRVDLSGFVRSYASVMEIGLLVSGASAIAPDHRKVLSASGSAPATFVSVQISATRVIHLSADDGLNEGTNTFTMVYRYNEDDPSGAGTVADREISVQPY